ncbi:MAG: RHS repeat-associated core domain-containing protein [Mangrovibacterium sp.]
MNSVVSTYQEKGGQYTKHIYIGSQRIVSKLGDVGSFGVDPRREEYAGTNVSGTSVPDYASKYGALQEVIKVNYAHFEIDYYGVDNDDYVNGEGFCCGETTNTKSIPVTGDNYEKLQYYYHPDHLGSASYITNLDGEVVQHIEYVPFGEVFIEERNNTWNTPFLFNGKEYDSETGLYYYGARYYNPRIGLWYGVDPLHEERYGLSPYQYCQNNPVMLTDPTGMLDDNYSVDDKGNVKLEEKTNDNFDRLYSKESWDDGTKSESIKVSDKGILPQLESKENVAKYNPKPTDIDQEVLYGVVANTSNAQDAYRIFKFSAENSNVEWSFQEYTDNTSSVTTSNKNATTLTGRHFEINKEKQISTDIHSHPNTYRDDLRPSSIDEYNMRVYLKENQNAKVQLYIPQVTNPNGRMLDMVNNKWILYGSY